MKSGKLKDLLLLFFLTFFMYNVNFRPIPAGDTVPAQLLPFSILRAGNLDLNEFGLTKVSSPPGSLLYAVFPFQSWQRVPGGSVLSAIHLGGMERRACQNWTS